MKAKRPLAAILAWSGRVLLVVLGLVVALTAYLLVRESIARSKYRVEYPRPGQMVSLDTHDLHLNCVGVGKPAVVFEADLDQYGSLSWDLVQGEIGKYTRACSYDRAGILWSEPGPRPRDGERIADELGAVLDSAGEEGPYLLVGHAFGGAYVRIFAGQHPDAVCGMVLVESSHPEMLTRFKEHGIVTDVPDRDLRPLILLLSHLGMPDRNKGNPYNLPPNVNDPVQAFLPESSMAWYDEKVQASNTLAQAGEVSNLGDMPLIVIATARPPSIIAQGQVLHDVWLELQQELLLLSEKSELVMVEVGHYPQLQSPELVIKAIQDVLEQCQETSL